MTDSSEGTSQGGGNAASSYVDPASPKAVLSRTKFLTSATVGLGALIGAAVAIPSIGFVLGPSFAGEDWYWTNLGPSDSAQWEEDKYIPVVYERAPGGNLERRVVFVRRNAGSPQGNEFTIVSNVCMHLGCPVVGTNVGFGCPCHGGQYDLEGRRTAGPPVRPLNRMEYLIDSGNLFVGRPFATKEENGEVVVTDIWKDPGQPTSGLLSILYPPPPPLSHVDSHPPRA